MESYLEIPHRFPACWLSAQRTALLPSNPKNFIAKDAWNACQTKAFYRIGSFCFPEGKDCSYNPYQFPSSAGPL